MNLRELSQRQIKLIAGTLAVVLAAAPIVYWNWGADQQTADDEGASGKAGQEKDPKTGKVDDKKKLKDKDKKKDEPPPEFDPPRLAVTPNDPSATGGLQGIKPGHWTVATLEMKANQRNWFTELQTSVMGASEGQTQIVPLERLPFYLTSRQPGIFPKGQKKYFDVSFFVPPLGELKPKLQMRVLERGGGEVSVPVESLTAMPAFQYYFVALANEPSKYAYLRALDAIDPPGGDFSTPATRAHYRLSFPKVEKRVPLPNHMLAWTSIAYVLWDDVNPSVLSPEQQQSLIDWLHFGGQLIISGPDSLAQLQQKDMFLEPFLPATAGDSREIAPNELVEFNDPLHGWSFELRPNEKDSPKRKLIPVKPWLGVQLSPRPGSAPLPKTGNLVIEKRVGAGRVVVTAFRLSQPDLVNWWGYDSFFNACLLRRPARQFIDNTTVQGTEEGPKYRWSTGPKVFNDPRMTTNFRLLSRDLGYDLQVDVERAKKENKKVPEADLDISFPQNFSPGDPLPQRGLGTWDDFNAVSTTAAQSLTTAAGIEIPRANFVFWSVAGYLLVLVPINWAFFRMLGRVEWAWIAAPILAILGTVTVTKMARLDIGFTRSEREIALVELHAGHPRAHVTRYTAHYTSLSSNYEFTYSDTGSQALPFATKINFELQNWQGRSNVEFHRDERTRLTGFGVSSNSTGTMHTEQVLDVGGGITLSNRPDGSLSDASMTVKNGTSLELRNVGVLHRRLDHTLELARIDALPPGQSSGLRFQQIQDKESNIHVLFPAASSVAGRESLWTEGRVLADLAQRISGLIGPAPTVLMQPTAADGTISTNPSSVQVPESNAELLGKAPPSKPPNPPVAAAPSLLAGETCLFAWTADDLPGVTSDPVAPQVKRASLIVAHLGYPRRPDPVRDTNPRSFDRNAPANFDDPPEPQK